MPGLDVQGFNGLIVRRSQVQVLPAPPIYLHLCRRRFWAESGANGMPKLEASSPYRRRRYPRRYPISAGKIVAMRRFPEPIGRQGRNCLGNGVRSQCGRSTAARRSRDGRTRKQFQTRDGAFPDRPDPVRARGTAMDSRSPLGHLQILSLRGVSSRRPLSDGEALRGSPSSRHTLKSSVVPEPVSGACEGRHVPPTSEEHASRNILAPESAEHPRPRSRLGFERCGRCSSECRGRVMGAGSSWRPP
jgi:hypothetical protein